jgi:oligopeptide/dipeptide ABC transporter ATP-binding protein
VVEIAPTPTLFHQPRHPYTEALLGAAPKPHPRYRGRAKILTGELPDPTQVGTGCHFYARCPYGQPICAEQYPPLRAQDETGNHHAACHFSHELTLQGI